MTDLEEAINVARKAVEATPEGHPRRAGRLSKLAEKLDRQYKGLAR
jgi:hypothetical protein